MISFDDLKGTPFMPISQHLYTIAGNDGTPIIGFKTLLKAEYKSSGKTVFEPIEQNSFATYNKTTEPREFNFTVALQYPNNDFASAMAKLEELKRGTDVFSFVTPFTEFASLTLEGYTTTIETFTSMMVIDLACKEIIEVQQGYANVKVNDATPIGQGDASNSDNADTVNTGMTGANGSTGEEQKQAEESIYYGWGLGPREVPQTNERGGGSDGF